MCISEPVIITGTTSSQKISFKSKRTCCNRSLLQQPPTKAAREEEEEEEDDDRRQVHEHQCIGRDAGNICARRRVLAVLRLLRAARLLLLGLRQVPPAHPEGGGRQELSLQGEGRRRRSGPAGIPDRRLHPPVHGGAEGRGRGRARGGRGRSLAGVLVLVGGGKADHGGDGGDGYMAVLRAQVHAREQVPVPAHPLEAPQPGGAVRLRGAVQPPAGGAAPGHRGRRRVVPRVRDDAPDRHLLLLPGDGEDGGRPLRDVDPGAPAPAAVQQQQRLPRRPPPALRRQVQLLAALLRDVGQDAGNPHAVHPGEGHGRGCQSQTYQRLIHAFLNSYIFDRLFVFHLSSKKKMKKNKKNIAISGYIYIYILWIKCRYNKYFLIHIFHLT